MPCGPKSWRIPSASKQVAGTCPPARDSGWRSIRKRSSGFRARLTNKIDNRIEGCPGLEDRGDPLLFEGLSIFIGDDAADNYLHVGHFILAQQIHDARNDGVMGAGEDG